MSNFDDPRPWGTPAATKPKPVKRCDIQAAADQLSQRCGFGSWRDSELILGRIVYLVENGETATSIMRRLNPPALPESKNSTLIEAEDWE